MKQPRKCAHNWDILTRRIITGFAHNGHMWWKQLASFLVWPPSSLVDQVPELHAESLILLGAHPNWKRKNYSRLYNFPIRKFRDKIVSWLNVHSNFYCQVNSISVSCSRVNNNAIAGWWFTAYHINLVQLCKVGLWIHNCMWCRFYLFLFCNKNKCHP